MVLSSWTCTTVYMTRWPTDCVSIKKCDRLAQWNNVLILAKLEIIIGERTLTFIEWRSNSANGGTILVSWISFTSPFHLANQFNTRIIRKPFSTLKFGNTAIDRPSYHTRCVRACFSFYINIRVCVIHRYNTHKARHLIYIHTQWNTCFSAQYWNLWCK